MENQKLEKEKQVWQHEWQQEREEAERGAWEETQR